MHLFFAALMLILVRIENKIKIFIAVFPVYCLYILSSRRKIPLLHYLWG